MKRFILIILVFLCGLFPNLKSQSLIHIDATINCPSLGTEEELDIYLPADYYNSGNENIYYPVVYYLHGWGGSQNSVVAYVNIYLNYMNQGEDKCVILVAANNNVDPFEGSVYMNSDLWGNYEDYNVDDVINWVDNNFRTLPERKGRALIGQSMGGYGAFRLALRHKEKYCAFAAHGAAVNNNISLDNIKTNMLLENSGPPYSYAYETGGSYTQWMFLLGGAVAPYPNTPQTYIDPDFIEYPFDENCNLIDTVWQKIADEDVLPMLHNTAASDSVGIFFGCGTNDDWGFYDANLALTDTLEQLGLPYEFYSHDGGHSPPSAFRERSIEFLDSLLMPPQYIPNYYIAEVENSAEDLEIFPNPAKSFANITYKLSQGASIKLTVINHLGQEVINCFNEFRSAGNQHNTIDVSDLSGGIYFLRLEAGKTLLTKKFVKL